MRVPSEKFGLIETAINCGVANFISLLTAAVYGNPGCCAQNRLVDQPWKIMPIAHRRSIGQSTVTHCES